MNQLDDILNEIDILKHVKHPNIISLIQMYQSNDYFYLVMDLVSGGELFDRILSRGSYTEFDAAHLIQQILDAIEYLHDKGIVHRDLKPENLLFKNSDENAELMISDFGLAKAVSSDEFLTTTCGSPHYVSPEVLKNTGHGKPVDMWAIGVITYVLLSGYTPFWGGENNSQTVLYQSIVVADYQFDPETWDIVSEDAKDFIRKLLVVDQDLRMTVQKAKKHPWLSNAPTVNLLPNVRKNFNAKKTLKKAVLAVAGMNRMAGLALNSP